MSDDDDDCKSSREHLKEDMKEFPYEIKQEKFSFSSPKEILAMSALSMSDKIVQLKYFLVENNKFDDEVKNALMNMLLNGPMLLDRNLHICCSEVVPPYLEAVVLFPQPDQVELWNTFYSIVNSNKSNLITCTEAGVLKLILTFLPRYDDQMEIRGTLIKLIRCFLQFYVNGEEISSLHQLIHISDGTWPHHAIDILTALDGLPAPDDPQHYFNFPGKQGSFIQLAPIAKFPSQNNWSFSTWFQLNESVGGDDLNARPHLFCFRTSKGSGFTCSLVHNCPQLVVARPYGKNLQMLNVSISYKFQPCKWYMITLVYDYNLLSKSEIHCYVNGQLISVGQLSWPFKTAEVFDKCFIGSDADWNLETSFSGQMTSIFGFNVVLTPVQVDALHALGPAYQGSFNMETESKTSLLSPSQHQSLYNGSLHNSLIFCYHPLASNTLLGFNQVPRGNMQIFQHSPHLFMKGDVKAVSQHPFHKALQYIGGVDALLPLFSQLELVEEDTEDVVSLLFGMVVDLLLKSPELQEQFRQVRGFLIIRHQLEQVSSRHLNEKFLERIIAFVSGVVETLSTAKLATFDSLIHLLSQLFDYLLLCPTLWVRATPGVQQRLYQYLSQDFVAIRPVFEDTRRTCSVLIMLHSLQELYVVNEKYEYFDEKEVVHSEKRVALVDLLQLRHVILQLIKRYILLVQEMGSNRSILVEQMQGVLKYLSVEDREVMLCDMMYMIMQLIQEAPNHMIPCLHQIQWEQVIFKHIGSLDEPVRVYALKVLTMYLCRCTSERKSETILKYNLFTLLTEKLSSSSTHLTYRVYTSLIELLTEKSGLTFPDFSQRHLDDSHKIENPLVLKVIAELIHKSKPNAETQHILHTFVKELLQLCSQSSDNIHSLLQVTIWQEWVLLLCPVKQLESLVQNEEAEETLSHSASSAGGEIELREHVIHLIVKLLYHSLLRECGGWRVWVDTAALIHSRYSREMFDLQHKDSDLPISSTDVDSVAPEPQQEGGTDLSDEQVQPATSDNPSLPFRLSTFQWNRLHLRLLRDLLSRIEEDLTPQLHRENTSVNWSENTTYISNVLILVAQTTDMLLLFCGGVLPLLAAATSNEPVEIKTDNQNVSPKEIIQICIRYMKLVEHFLFKTSISIKDLDQEKRSPEGTFIRSILRLILFCAVRNCLESKYRTMLAVRDLTQSLQDGTLLKSLLATEGLEFENLDSQELQSPYTKSIFLVINWIASEEEQSTRKDTLSINPTVLLQDDDISHLQAILQHDAENNVRNPYMALVIVYFISVLMVSRYRDLLELSKSQNMEEARQTHSEEQDSASARRYSLDKITSLPQRLEVIMSSTANLLHKVFSDFAPFLSKHLMGSHGQELFTSGLTTLRQETSPVALVMLLCSQEWQNALQKYAGSAFVDFVNEGQSFAEAQRNYLARVSTQAEYILNLNRSRDICMHAEFQQISSQSDRQRIEEHRDWALQVQASKAREADFARRQMRRIQLATDIVENKSTSYELDSWEDDSRRRQRFVISKPLHESENEVCAGNEENQNEEIGFQHLMQFLGVPGSQNETESYGITDEQLSTLEPTAMTLTALQKRATEMEERNAKENSMVASKETLDGSAMSTDCLLIVPGCSIQGKFRLTKRNMYFQMYRDHVANKSIPAQILENYSQLLWGKWSFHKIRGVHTRRYFNRNTALEIFLTTRRSVMFAFPNQSTVRQVVNRLPSVGLGSLYRLLAIRSSSLASPQQVFRLSNMTQRWQQHELSNFDYLMFLNTIAGRTYNDLNQYPIFPWVLADYESEHIALQSAKSYRDLSKPLTALNPQNREHLEGKYQRKLNENFSQGEFQSPMRQYSHLAHHHDVYCLTEATVLSYLQNMEPFSHIHKLKQLKTGKREPFAQNMSHLWSGSVRGERIMELVPEFFYLSDMFTSVKQSESSAMLLPSWASTPDEFIRINRQALESEIVSRQLHEWIDIVFGYKQRGPESVMATNVYSPFAYQNNVDFSRLSSDPNLEKVFQRLLTRIGQVPSQLLIHPHPPRHQLTIPPSLNERSLTTQEMCMVMKYSSNSSIVFLAAATQSSLASSACVVSVMANHGFAINRWNRAAVPSKNLQAADHPLNQVDNASLTSTSSASILPISMDPLLMNYNEFVPARHLGDDFDPNVATQSVHFAMSPDAKVLFVCGFWDRSFRAVSLQSNKVLRSIVAHSGLVTCIGRSENVIGQDLFVITGGEDCVARVWLWSATKSDFVDMEKNLITQHPAGLVLLTGHSTAITCVAVSSELGMTFTSSKEKLLIHGLEEGALLHCIQFRNHVPSPIHQSISTVTRLFYSREGHIIVQPDSHNLLLFSLSGRFLKAFAPFSSIDETDYIQSLLLTRSGSFVIIGSNKGRLCVLRCYNFKMVHEFTRCDGAVRSMTLSHDQRCLFVGLETGCIDVYNMDFSRWSLEIDSGGG